MLKRTVTRFALFWVAGALALLTLSACGDTPGTANADLLKRAVADMKAATSYTIDADFNQDGQQVKLTGQIDAAGNNSKLRIDTGGQTISLITVGDDAFISTDGGATFVDTGTRGESIAQSFTGFVRMWNGFLPDQVDKHREDLKDGNPPTEKINDVDTKRITCNAKSLSLASNSAESTTDGTVDLWISTGTPTPYIVRLKLDGTTGGQPVQGTYTWGNFNQKVDIKPPPASLIQNRVGGAGK